MKEIQIKYKDEIHIALVDDEDYSVLSKHLWYLSWKPSGGAYAFMMIHTKGYPQHMLHMHHLVAGTFAQIDHIDGNKLNNQKNNLRVATYSENGANRRKTTYAGKPCSSKYKGVHVHGKTGMYRAVVTKNRKAYQCGTYKNEDDAARAYNKKAFELYGQFALLNDVPMPEVNIG